MFLTTHYRTNLIDLQFCDRDPSDLSVIKSLAGCRCPFQPTIHGIPGQMLDSGNRGFVHSFDAQSSDLIEYRSPVLKAMIDRAMGSAEGLTTTRTSESATVAPPGAIEAIPDHDLWVGLLSGTLLVGTAETLHGDWTCSLVGLVAQEMGFKSYDKNELQCTCQH